MRVNWFFFPFAQAAPCILLPTSVAVGKDRVLLVRKNVRVSFFASRGIALFAQQKMLQPTSLAHTLKLTTA